MRARRLVVLFALGLGAIGSLGAPCAARAQADTVDRLLAKAREARRSVFNTDTASVRYARGFADQALRIAHARKDFAREADALGTISWLFWVDDRYDSTFFYTKAATEAARQSRDSLRLLKRELSLASAYANIHQLDSTRAIDRRVIAAWRARGDSAQVAYALGEFAAVELATRPDSAIAYLTTSIPLLIAQRDTEQLAQLAYVVSGAARAKLDTARKGGRPSDALPALRFAANFAKRPEAKMVAIDVDTLIARVYSDLGERDSALVYLRPAAAGALQRSDPYTLQQIMSRIVVLERGHTSVDSLIRDLKLLEVTEAGTGRPDSTLREIADAYARTGRADSAVRYLIELDQVQERQDRVGLRDRERWRTSLRVVNLLADRGDPDSTILFLRTALLRYDYAVGAARFMHESRDTPFMRGAIACAERTTMLLNLFAFYGLSSDESAVVETLKLGYALEAIPEASRALAGSGETKLFSPHASADSSIRDRVMLAWAARSESRSDAFTSERDALHSLGVRERRVGGGPISSDMPGIARSDFALSDNLPTDPRCHTAYDVSSLNDPSDEDGQSLAARIDGSETLLAFAVARDTLVIWLVRGLSLDRPSFALVRRRPLGASTLTRGDILPPEWEGRLRPGSLLVALPSGALGTQVEQLLRQSFIAGYDLHFSLTVIELTKKKGAPE